jgi:hypothetical protein
VLCLESAQLDLLRFEALLTEGREQLGAGDAKAAATTLHEALELWRGPLLADLADEPFVIAEAARLEHLRLDALKACFEAELAAGRRAEIAAELEAAVAGRLAPRCGTPACCSPETAAATTLEQGGLRDAAERTARSLGMQALAAGERVDRDAAQNAP